MAHSAGGWISRLYLSTAAYDGRAYNGARFVSALVTLGSPHVRTYVLICTHRSLLLSILDAAIVDPPTLPLR